MMKRLLSILALAALVATAGAQAPKEFAQPKHSAFKHVMPQATAQRMMKAPAALQEMELEPGQQWFGYWYPEQMIPLGIYDSKVDYALGIYVPYDQMAGQGATIDGVRFYLTSTAGIKNVKAWVSTKLADIDHYTDGYDLEIKDVETISEGYNEVAFAGKYTIPEGGIYVGFYFEAELDMSEYPVEDYTTYDEYVVWYEKYLAWVAAHPEANPFVISDSPYMHEGTMYFASKYQDDMYRQYATIPGYEFYLNYLGWEDYGPYGYNLGCEALIGGDKFYANAAGANDFGEKYAGVGENVTFPVTISSFGSNGLQNFTYEVAINGQKIDEQTITLEQPITKQLGYTSVPITFNAGQQAGTQQIELTIAKVNGEANERTGAAMGSIVVLTEFAKMKPLIEEYTGTWCGWCTRGWVGLEKLAEDFGDEVVLIASHNGDPMEIEEYMPVQDAYIQGFPSMLINRVTDVDPYHGSTDNEPYYIKNDVERILTDISPVGIEVKAKWADEAQTKIQISTETKFYYDVTDPTMAIGYILVADGLKGTGRSWAQANYYCDYAEEYGNDPYLGELTRMGEYILDMTYNHVAVAGWGVMNGVDGSISGAIKAGEPVNGTFEADLNGVLIGEDRTSADPEDHVAVLDMIKDKKLTVVAFLINQNTGEVLNANQVVLQEDPAVSIDAIETSGSSESIRYNLSGQRISAPQSGLNIIRRADGTTLKALVK